VYVKEKPQLKTSVTQCVNEDSDMAGHLGDGVRDLPGAMAYASIVEEYNAASLGED
jgi:hypothetical protein